MRPIVWDIGWLFVIAAVIAFAIAAFAVGFDVDNAKVYPMAIAIGGACAVLGLKS